jgi:WD40 repeat protein
MQPIYIAGHSRPVRKVQYNFDGDLLFTCSDDGNVCMYNTTDCQRIGVFPVKESVKSMDVTKDSQYLIATATTFGVCIFNVFDGKELKKLRVTGADKTVTCQMK